MGIPKHIHIPPKSLPGPIWHALWSHSWAKEESEGGSLKAPTGGQKEAQGHPKRAHGRHNSRKMNQNHRKLTPQKTKKMKSFVSDVSPHVLSQSFFQKCNDSYFCPNAQQLVPLQVHGGGVARMRWWAMFPELHGNVELRSLHDVKEKMWTV